MEVQDATTAHVVHVRGLNVQPLTLEQAIIIQGFTGLGHVPPVMMDEDRQDRGIDLWGGKCHHAYREDFARLAVHQDEMADYKELAGRIYDAILDKMINDPFAMWDTRVDVLLGAHINHKTQAALRVALELFHDATASFTERPGDSNQTWIVINRPDPTNQAMRKAMDYILDTICTALPTINTIEMALPCSIPLRHEQAFKYQVQHLSGFQVQTINRGRFTKHKTDLVLTNPSALGNNDGGSGNATIQGSGSGIKRPFNLQPESDGDKLDHNQQGRGPN